jgi:hypothetical protein
MKADILSSFKSVAEKEKVVLQSKPSQSSSEESEEDEEAAIML